MKRKEKQNEVNLKVKYDIVKELSAKARLNCIIPLELKQIDDILTTMTRPFTYSV